MAETCRSILYISTKCIKVHLLDIITRWFKYDWDYLCVNKSQFVPVIFEPPCILNLMKVHGNHSIKHN